MAARRLVPRNLPLNCDRLQVHFRFTLLSALAVEFPVNLLNHSLEV
jgi:hypothetical protein